MGCRGTLKIITPELTLCLYTHQGARTLPNTLQRALKSIQEAPESLQQDFARVILYMYEELRSESYMMRLLDRHGLSFKDYAFSGLGLSADHFESCELTIDLDLGAKTVIVRDDISPKPEKTYTYSEFLASEFDIDYGVA